MRCRESLLTRPQEHDRLKEMGSRARANSSVSTYRAGIVWKRIAVFLMPLCKRRASNNKVSVTLLLGSVSCSAAGSSVCVFYGRTFFVTVRSECMARVSRLRIGILKSAGEDVWFFTPGLR